MSFNEIWRLVLRLGAAVLLLAIAASGILGTIWIVLGLAVVPLYASDLPAARGWLMAGWLALVALAYAGAHVGAFWLLWRAAKRWL
jgi:hypothetical protein